MKILDIMGIPLSRGLFALVDGWNYERLNRYKWHAEKNRKRFYARRREGNRNIRMHTEVFGHVPAGKILDHINRCGLDNRESNIRAITPRENSYNTELPSNNQSGFRGVFRLNGRWIASISDYYKTVYLGSFGDITDAAMAYDQAARKLRGEFAQPNFPAEEIVRAVEDRSLVYSSDEGGQYFLFRDMVEERVR